VCWVTSVAQESSPRSVYNAHTPRDAHAATGTKQGRQRRGIRLGRLLGPRQRLASYGGGACRVGSQAWQGNPQRLTRSVNNTPPAGLPSTVMWDISKPMVLLQGGLVDKNFSAGDDVEASDVSSQRTSRIFVWCSGSPASSCVACDESITRRCRKRGKCCSLFPMPAAGSGSPPSGPSVPRKVEWMRGNPERGRVCTGSRSFSIYFRPERASARAKVECQVVTSSYRYAKTQNPFLHTQNLTLPSDFCDR
jgi:hypothetical protein